MEKQLDNEMMMKNKIRNNDIWKKKKEKVKKWNKKRVEEKRGGEVHWRKLRERRELEREKEAGRSPVCTSIDQ